MRSGRKGLDNTAGVKRMYEQEWPTFRVGRNGELKPGPVERVSTVQETSNPDVSGFASSGRGRSPRPGPGMAGETQTLRSATSYLKRC